MTELFFVVASKHAMLVCYYSTWWSVAPKDQVVLIMVSVTELELKKDQCPLSFQLLNLWGAGMAR